MFGAESILLDRCESQDVFDAASDMLNGFKDYFISHGEVVYENPSPGNKDGGITTLEDKSCGCVQKGGSAPIVDVLPYAGQATKHGLNMLCGPGNDMVSTTALTAAGCHVILFSTGRGTPFGAPAPTLKVFTNQRLCDHNANWMDFNAGVVATGRAHARRGCPRPVPAGAGVCERQAYKCRAPRLSRDQHLEGRRLPVAMTC